MLYCMTYVIFYFLGLPKPLYIKNNYCYIVNITRDIIYFYSIKR